MRRKEQKLIWLIPEDSDKLQRLCEQSGLSLSSVVSTLVSSGELRPRVPLEYAKILEGLDRIGTNINQIAHSMNYWKEVRQESVEECLHRLNELYALMSEWKRSEVYGDNQDNPD